MKQPNECTVTARKFLLGGGSLTAAEANQKWGCTSGSFSKSVIQYLEGQGHTLSRVREGAAFRYQLLEEDDDRKQGSAPAPRRQRAARLPELGDQLQVKSFLLADDEGTVHIGLQGPGGTWLVEVVGYARG